MKRNILKIGFFLGMITFLFTMNTNAQSSNREQKKPPSTEEIFKMMDANKDGQLSLKEVKGRLKNDFSKIDTDENGFITKEELEKAPKPNRQKGKQAQQPAKQKEPSASETLKMMDANNDGKLSKEEVKGPLANGFSKIDTDEDGFLSKEELEKAPKPKTK